MATMVTKSPIEPDSGALASAVVARHPAGDVPTCVVADHQDHEQRDGGGEADRAGATLSLGLVDLEVCADRGHDGADDAGQQHGQCDRDEPSEEVRSGVVAAEPFTALLLGSLLAHSQVLLAEPGCSSSTRPGRPRSCVGAVGDGDRTRVLAGRRGRGGRAAWAGSAAYGLNRDGSGIRTWAPPFRRSAMRRKRRVYVGHATAQAPVPLAAPLTPARDDGRREVVVVLVTGCCERSHARRRTRASYLLVTSAATPAQRHRTSHRQNTPNRGGPARP